MQSKFTLHLKSFSFKFISFTLVMFALLGKTSFAQTTITATQTLTTVASIVTFNFTNNNATPVVITRIDAVLNNAAGILVDVTGFVKTSPVAGPPGPITATNGWIQFASRTVTSTGAFTNIQVLASALTIPAGATYGIAINGVRSTDATVPGRIVFNNGTGTFTPTFTAGGCVLTTGPNVSFNTFTPTSPQSPTGGPTYFVGAITFVPGVVCTGTPSAGNTLSNSPTSCPGVPFTLSPSVTQPVSTTGLTYQLQSSPTTGGTFTNVGLPSLFRTFNVTQTTSTAYRILITCTNGGGSSSSVPIFIPANAICYCNAGATSTGFEKISNVTFANINRSSTSTAGYENFTTDTAQVISGGTYPITVTGNALTYSGDIVRVWIDFNKNGSFTDPGETVYTSTPSAGPFRGLITIPSTALLGSTRMRIRLFDGTNGTVNGTSCGNSTFGQVEDYTININPCVAIAFTSQPANVSTVCGGNITFTVGITGSLPAYQWQYRINSTSPWLVVPNTPPYSGANSATLTLTNVSSALNGYQYRVVVSGACTGADFSSPATLTVTPLAPVVTPTSAAICSGTNTIVPISIGNFGQTQTSTFSSPANLALPISESGTGTTHIMPVTLPASAQITDIKVRLNINHTWVGDMIIALRAPNGQVYNLSYALDGTDNGPGRFTNTVISFGPNGLGVPFPSLSTGTNPFTSTFRVDGRTAATATPLDNGVDNLVRPTGPTGFIATTNVPSVFFGGMGVGTGGWTIAMYDFYDDGANGGSINRLVNWAMDITYGSLATGIFTSTPAAPNTIFSDALATIPYDGVTPVNTVYVKPAVSTVYNVAINTGTCTANTTIPVTVNTALMGTPTVANVATCAGSNAVFSYAGITAGTGLTFQWQVSTSGAPTTFTNIAGATSATYTVNAATATQSGNNYRVIITAAGCSGSLTSTAGMLTVNPIPVVTISAAPLRNLFPGLTTTLTAAVSPNPTGALYQWFRNGRAVTGATSNTLVVGIDALGSYSVRVTSASGCIATAGTSSPNSILIGDSTGVTKLFIYPSPNNGKFQVRYFSDINNGSKNPAMLNVYDERGTRVFSRYYGISSGYQQMDVDLGAHSSGIYRVDLLDLNGDRIKTGSVMVF